MHRIEAEVGGRPLYLFAFLGERRLLLDAGCASTVDEFIAPFLEGLGLGLRDLDVLVVTHSDLDHQGGAHLLKRANPSLWVTCGVLDIPLVSDPEALIAERYQAYAELHGIAPDEGALDWMRRESGGAVRVDVGWSGGELLELGPEWSACGSCTSRVTRSATSRSTTSAPGRCSAATASRARSTSDWTGRQSSALRIRTSTTTSRPQRLVESLAPRELHGCHWPAARGDEVAAFIAETRDYVEHIDGLVRGASPNR